MRLSVLVCPDANFMAVPMVEYRGKSKWQQSMGKHIPLNQLFKLLNYTVKLNKGLLLRELSPYDFKAVSLLSKRKWETYF